MKCFAHISGISGDISPFRQDAWLKYLHSVNGWKDLGGNQAEIARNFIKEFGEVIDSATDSIKDSLTIPPHGGCHKRCYQYFTNISKQGSRILGGQFKLCLLRSPTSLEGTWFTIGFATILLPACDYWIHSL